MPPFSGVAINFRSMHAGIKITRRYLSGDSQPPGAETVKTYCLAVTDGLNRFDGVKDKSCAHGAIMASGGPASVTREAFIWIDTLIGNVKNRFTVHVMRSMKNNFRVIWLSFVTVSIGGSNLTG